MPARADALPLILHLTVNPAHDIPAAPPGIILRVTNTSSSPIDLPHVQLEVTPEGGQTFMAHSDLDMFESWEEYLDPLQRVEPGATVTLEFARALAKPSWFCDERIGDPGRYTLRAVMVGRGVGLEALPKVFSNAATFTIDVPAGEDAGAWALKRSLSGGGCAWPYAVGRRIAAEFPRSRYAAWQVEIRPGDLPEVNIAKLEAAIAKDPHGLMADWNRLEIAQERTTQVNRALPGYPSANLDTAIWANEQRRSILKELIHSENPGVRFASQREMLGVPSAQEVERYYRELEEDLNPNSAPYLRPIVVCVAAEGGRLFSAKFRYENHLNKSVKISIGKGNSFSPKPIDRGQPTVFELGDDNKTFKVKHIEGELVWTLDGKQATASLRDSPRCND